MYDVSNMQNTASSLFSAYASLAASMMLVRTIANDFIPKSLLTYIQSAISYLFTPLSTRLTIIVDEQCGMTRNQVYEAAEIYLRTKIGPNADRVRAHKAPKQKNINVSIEKDEEINDVYGVVQMKWRLVSVEPQERHGYSPEKRFFELSFNKKFKESVLNEYLPFVLTKAKEIQDNDRAVKLYTRDCPCGSDDDGYGYGGGGGGVWGSINLDHPATFDTLAMEPEMKKMIIEDLDRFVKRRDFYKKVGKAWKRGYLLYGPPGTGKSSLIAAMANYLKFDIYDLELTSLYSNSELRRILISTSNRSIIVIEDIDCSMEMHDRNLGHQSTDTKITLSGLLNFIDGLWSNCGDERIIIFTTNHKEKLDPALLRPGRMDMHIHMSYCTNQSFKILAFNYLGVSDHKLFGEIEGLIKNVEVTPAEVAEELMRSEDADVVLEGVVNLLKRKAAEANEIKEESPKTPEGDDKDEKVDGGEIQEAKRMRTEVLVHTFRNQRRGRMRIGRPSRGRRGGRL
ncbi:unnamed protein product [Withania somnifera]